MGPTMAQPGSCIACPNRGSAPSWSSQGGARPCQWPSKKGALLVTKPSYPLHKLHEIGPELYCIVLGFSHLLEKVFQLRLPFL